MQHYIIEFYPPIIGLENHFNTVRLGLAWSKKLNVGDKVYLSDNKQKLVIGEAVVTELHTGSLEEICQSHAQMNHTQLEEPDKAKTPDGLMSVIQKFYGPHIAVPTKKATAIYLRRLG